MIKYERSSKEVPPEKKTPNKHTKNGIDEGNKATQLYKNID